MKNWYNSKKIFVNIDDFCLYFFGILRIGGIGTVWAQKIARIKSMKFTRFDCLFLKSHV